jgi:hypothetical protein
VPRADECDPHFHRGIVEGVECQSLSPLFEAADALFTLFPIRELHFWWQYSIGLNGDSVRKLAGLPGLDRLTKLRLANYDSPITYAADTPAAWEEFTGCQRLTGLRVFGVDCARLSDADLEVIAASPELAGLHTLTLEQNRFTAIGVRAVLDSPHLKGLKRLSLGGNDSACEELRDELAERFPVGENPLDLFLEMDWFED